MHRRMIAIATSTTLAAGLVLAACGSAGDAACDDYAKYCGLSTDHEKIALCRKTNADKCGAEATEWLRCLLDNGGKCNAASELSNTDQSRAACDAKAEAYRKCSP